MPECFLFPLFGILATFASDKLFFSSSSLKCHNSHIRKNDITSEFPYPKYPFANGPESVYQ